MSDKVWDHFPPNVSEDVAQFILLSQPQMVGKPKQMPSLATIQLAIHLIEEEVNKELLPLLRKMEAGAYSLEIMAELLDAIVDSCYVIIWTAIVFCLPFNEGWNEVQRSNMSKFPLISDWEQEGYIPCNPLKVDGTIDQDTPNKVMRSGDRFTIVNTETGKVMKPEGWTPPNMWQLVFDAWEDYTSHNQKDGIFDVKLKEDHAKSR